MNILITELHYNIISFGVIVMRSPLFSAVFCALFMINVACLPLHADQVQQKAVTDPGKNNGVAAQNGKSRTEKKKRAFADSLSVKKVFVPSNRSSEVTPPSDDADKLTGRSAKLYECDDDKLTALKSMDLKSVIEYAYRNNPELRAAIAEKQAKDEALAQAFSEYYPDIALRLSAGRSFDRNRTNVKLDENKDRESSIDRSSSTNTSAALTLSQNIFNGLGTKYKVEAAEANVLANRYAVSSKIQEIIMKVVSAYMELWEAEQRVAIAQRLRDNLWQSLNSESNKMDAGMTNRQEYEARKSAYADAEYRLSEAKARRNTALAEFKMVTCMDAVGKTSFPQVALDVPKDLKIFVARAMENNPSLLSTRFVEYAARKRVRVSKSELMPHVNLELSAERDLKNHYRRHVLPTEMRNRGYEDGKQPCDKRSLLSAKLNVIVPIVKDGGRSYSNIRQNNKEALKAGFDYKSALLRVEQECRSVWSVYRAALDQITQSKVAVESARITVEGFKKSEELGKVSSTDVIYNERNLLERRQQEVEANKKWVLAKFKILMCEGLLENFIGVNWNIRTYDLRINENTVRGGALFY